MKPNPMRTYRPPAYPTRLEALADPGLLREHLPAAWLLRTELAGAVAIFLAANALVNAADKGAAASPKGPAAPKTAIVAPIFEHGEGRGVMGCVVVAAPVFLSEEEALQVISDELTSAGLKVTDRNIVVKEVEISKREEDYPNAAAGDWKPRVVEVPRSAKPLTIDLEDSGRHVAVEFVSESDYRDLGGIESHSTVQGYDFKGTAQELVKIVGRKAKGIYFGAFYDPSAPLDKKDVADAMAISFPEAGRSDDADTTRGQARRQELERRWRETETKARTESKRLLREQVRDFIDWLKGQGVL